MWKSTCFFLCVTWTCVNAAGQPGASPLDDQLLEGLDRPASSPSKPPRVGEDLGGPRHDSPIAEVVQQMQSVGQRLHRCDTSAETLKLQGDIVRKLSDVIDLLEQQTDGANQSASASAMPGGQAATNPGNTVQAHAAPNSSSATSEAQDAVNSIEKVWGLLPERLREQIQSPVHEEFLPRYERVIREYYKRMAAEQGPVGGFR